MKYLCLIAFAFIAGCATSSGALKMGPDTFSITSSASPGRGGGSAAKKIAYDEATAECTKQSKDFEVINETASRPSWTDGMHTVELTFRCVKR